ncbi:hypothetical protein HHL22_08000 [Hymenobacter sp. RP-2-7]|uniref:Uncharacterized protein n=1 Tax=Hymenobacter polaris TaxID=2682546 RepID=A0A7Y0FM52_9BACT|nr:hypothetical protein [Hymenobacter polaris]NML65145.1 hypothetical protein [Hymenobacter polaris]
MKHAVLPLLLVLGFRAQAQLAPLVRLAGIGTSMAVGSAANNRRQKETLFVVPATFGTHAIPQKRTPTGKLPKPDKGGTEIQALEQLLAGRYAALQADSTVILLSVAQEKEFSQLRTSLEAFNPFWNTGPYSAEMNCYRQHDDVRRRLARQATTR